MKHLIALTVAAAIAGCAQSPDAIAPVAMSSQSYDYMNCTTARQSLDNERATLAALSSQQKQAAIGDAVGVFLIAVPVSSLTGGDKAGLIGASKGKVQALEMRVARC